MKVFSIIALIIYSRVQEKLLFNVYSFTIPIYPSHRRILLELFSVVRHHGSNITYVFYVPVGHITISKLGQTLSCGNRINSEDLCSHYQLKCELPFRRIDYRNK